MKAVSDIGLIGLAVMGENLVLNMESKGFHVSVYNRTVEKVDKFMEGRGKGKNIYGARTLEDFVASLKTPRKVFLMVKAGQAVDAFIDKLIPVLEPGDIIIDGGIGGTEPSTIVNCTEGEAEIVRQGKGWLEE